MIAVVQRVDAARVEVEGVGVTGDIGHGLCVLLGVEVDDTEADAGWMAGKIARLRIFSDADGRFNDSVVDVSGSVLLVSQFTLAGDCSRGNRPSFGRAAPPDVARPLYLLVGRMLSEEQGRVETGGFRVDVVSS